MDQPRLIVPVFIGKIPTPIKIKLALPPPSKKNRKPPLKGGILWALWFSCRKNQKMPGAQKIGAAISGPRIAGGNLMDTTIVLAHRNRSDFYDLRLRCPSRTPEIARFPRQEKAMLHWVRWKVASDLRFRAAISEPKTPSFCGISGDLAPSTWKSLAIAIVRFWCAKAIVPVSSSIERNERAVL